MAQGIEQHGNVAALTQYNRARVIRALYRRGVCSRADIARAVELTPTAITKIAGDLIDIGAIKETGTIAGRAGRRSIGLCLNGERYRVIGVTFERSSVTMGVFTLEGHPAADAARATLHVGADEDARRVVSRTQDWIRARLAEDPAIVAVGITIPGPYLPEDGRIAVVTIANDWESIDFRSSFLEAFEVPVWIEHDAGAGALAHKLLSARCAGADSLAYLLLGEGVGLGVIDHDRLLAGVHGGAGEIGHISIDLNGPVCKCGNRGCLELYCSASAVASRLPENRFERVFGAVSETMASSGNTTAPVAPSPIAACRGLFALAGDGEEWALAEVRRIGAFVGYACVNVINAYDPGLIVLGDLMAEAGEPLLEAARAVVDERVAPALAQRTEITLTDLAADGVLSGAVALAIEHALDHPAAFAR